MSLTIYYMLQAECAYGGLITEGGTEYGFTYFPGEGVRSTWELLLDTADIAGMTIGAQKELTLWVCQSPNCGNKFSDPEEACFEHDYTG